jgi:hypothetical protein
VDTLWVIRTTWNLMSVLMKCIDMISEASSAEEGHGAGWFNARDPLWDTTLSFLPSA